MMNEQEYKDIRLTLDYNESRAAKIQKKIDSQTAKKEQAQKQLNDFDYQVSVIDCALDRLHLLNEAKNWENRRQRAIERVMRVLKARDGLYQLREALNARFAELVGDKEPLVHDLTLKSNLKIYAI